MAEMPLEWFIAEMTARLAAEIRKREEEEDERIIALLETTTSSAVIPAAGVTREC